MEKNAFKKELLAPAPVITKDSGNNIEIRIQEFLTIAAMGDPSLTAIDCDGDWGPATTAALNRYQKKMGLPVQNFVDATCWANLTSNLRNAFAFKATGNARQAIVDTAKYHASCRPFETKNINKGNNCGPWVRSYMDGSEGEDMYWCVGSGQTVVAQALLSIGKDLRELMKPSWSCDMVALEAKAKGTLTTCEDVRAGKKVVKPGDFFILKKSKGTGWDWYHFGIVTSVLGGGVIETAEGNTNSGGSSNGNSFQRRTRNYNTSLIDFVSVEMFM